ncbi:MAG: transglutaminase family protein [Planctomycetales bacterium]|nr:transglutaminase family protein [Planctomycetales bacterium]
MKYAVQHRTSYNYSQAVPVCHNIVHLMPRSLPHQSCSDFHLLVRPEPESIWHEQDAFGNHMSYFSIEQAHRGLTVTATSQVTLTQPDQAEPDSTVAWDELASRLRQDHTQGTILTCPYAFPSRSVPILAETRAYAEVSFPPGKPVLAGALDLTRRIHKDFAYDPRATSVHTPVSEVFQLRRGVCQDFAHLQLSCLRSLGLAARYVSGYLRTLPPPGKPRLIGADASHAWISIYCGRDGWVDLDPTNNTLTRLDHVTVAWGRDYHDVCPIQGVILGGGDHQMQVSVDLEALP